MTAIPFSQTDAQHIDTDESDLEAYRANVDAMKNKLGNGGTRRLDTAERDSNPYKLVTTKSPAMANTIRIGWNNAAGRPVYEFRQSSVVLAVLDTGVVGNEAHEAALKGFYSMLKFPVAKGDIIELWPRVQITFEPETAKDIDTQTGVVRTLRNVVTALELLPLDDKDRSAYYVQELKSLARERGLLTSDAYPVIRQHVIDKGRRAIQTDYEAARTALNALATKKEENMTTKNRKAPEYQPASVANAGADLLPVFNAKPETLEDALPRDEHGKPVGDSGEPPAPPVDELTGQADGEPPKHWANEGWWNAKLNKEVKATVKQTAIMPDAEWRKVAHELLSEALHMPIASFKDVDPTKLDGESALKAISAELKLRYGVKPPEPEKKSEVEWYRDPDSLGVIEQKLSASNLPMELGIAPSQVMSRAYAALKINNMREWAQQGKTGKEFYFATLHAWDDEIKAREAALAEIIGDEPEQPAQAASTSTEPPATPDTTQTTHSAPAVNGYGQSSPALEKTIEARPTALAVMDRQPQPSSVAHQLNVKWEITPIQMATFAAKSGLYKGVDSPEKAMMIMLRGLELNVSPVTALEQVNIINGKTSVSSALFLALIERSGQLENMTVDDSKQDAVTVTLKRRGRDAIVSTWTMDDAKKMQLSGKDNWQKQPKNMLYHRALGQAGRRAFADVLLFGGGAIYMHEKMDSNIVVDENGEMIA